MVTAPRTTGSQWQCTWLSSGTTLRLAGFALFLAAALSDIWDGYLARKHGWISDFGKLWDPIADKLLMVAVFVPIYMVSHGGGSAGRMVAIDVFPLWILLVGLAVALFLPVGGGLKFLLFVGVVAYWWYRGIKGRRELIASGRLLQMAGV